MVLCELEFSYFCDWLVSILLCTVHLLVVAVAVLLMDMISEKVVLYTEMVIALDSVKLV